MEGESELRSLRDLEEKLGEVIFPFDEIVPDSIGEWLTTYSKSHGTTRELLLMSSLSCTSALIGKTTLEVFSTYEEKGNIFTIVVAPSGSGKSPACHLGCIDPIVKHLEPKVNQSILLDVASANGLFNHFVSSSTVPILCIDEAHSFLTKISCESKSSQVNLSMERICKCFDGDCWYVLKGNKGKRNGVSSSRASLLAFTTPRQFLEKAWPKILNTENGLAERVLFFYQKRYERDLEEMSELCLQLNDLPVKNLNIVFEQIFGEHNNDDQVKYALSTSAREAFFKFAKPQENIMPTQSSASQLPGNTKCQNSKRNSHVLRIALNMHILYERLSKALNHETGPTTRSINLITMNMAISLVETLETYKGISELCCHLKSSEPIKLGIGNTDIEKRLLEVSGPYTTARRVYTSFTSRNRPTASVVQNCMVELEKQGLGTCKNVNKHKVFYKKLPSDNLKPKLALHGMSLEQYIAIFKCEDERLTTRNKEAFLDHHPNVMDLEAYLEQNV